MKIVSTNIGAPTFIIRNGKRERTGIYKKPTTKPIFLGKVIVKGDEVSNRKVHGGEFKACYLFSANNYIHWENLYPNLDWYYGMLGENLTVEGLDETKLFVGDIYKAGNALIQITQPREPCATFGTKMGSMDVLKQFIDHSRPGTYVRVLEEGTVAVNDKISLVESAPNSLSIADFFKLIFDKEKDQEHLERAQTLDAIPLKKRVKLGAYIKQ